MNDQIYENRERYVHFSGSGTKINKSGPTRLVRVIVNDAATQTLTLYDNPAATGDVIAVIDCQVAGTYEYGIPLRTGLTAVLSGTADVTVVYR